MTSSEAIPNHFRKRILQFCPRLIWNITAP
jgi:hypothetical protein